MARALAFSWDSEVLGHILGIAAVSAGQILCPEDLGEQVHACHHCCLWTTFTGKTGNVSNLCKPLPIWAFCPIQPNLIPTDINDVKWHYYCWVVLPKSNLLGPPEGNNPSGLFYAHSSHPNHKQWPVSLDYAWHSHQPPSGTFTPGMGKRSLQPSLQRANSLWWQRCIPNKLAVQEVWGWSATSSGCNLQSVKHPDEGTLVQLIYDHYRLEV